VLNVPSRANKCLWLKDGPYKGALTGIDYECLFANSSCCGISDIRAAIKMIDIEDESGMDAMSSGVTIAFALECYERGVLKKEDFKCKKYPDGFEANFGNAEAGVTLAELIRDKEGIGALLSDGTRIASRTLDKERGTESYKWAMNVKGLECPGYDARGLKTFALGAAVGPRGGCHNRSAAYDVDITGETDRFKVDEKHGEYARESEEYAAVYDTLPLCKFIRRCFTGKADRSGAWPSIAALINATTGWNYEYKDIDLIGERAFTIKKAFNIREGWTRKEDDLNWRWKHEPMTKGASAGYIVTDEELEEMKNQYYKAKGWNNDGMIPKSKLIETWNA